MTSAVQSIWAREVERVLEWLYGDELRHSRLIWRFEADRQLEPPWPYGGVWYDPAGAVVVDLGCHPTLGGTDPPWFHVDADDLDALELLCGVRLPMSSEVLCGTLHTAALRPLGRVSSTGVLEVYACRPGELGEAALPYEPTRLTTRHRRLVAEVGWRPEDLSDETDESRDGVRWAILRDDRIVSRLLVQRVSKNVCEIADVHTRPELRRRGYGAALVQAVVRRLHERGLTATYSVHPSNQPSRRLASRIGFRYQFTWERVRLERG